MLIFLAHPTSDIGVHASGPEDSTRGDDKCQNLSCLSTCLGACILVVRGHDKRAAVEQHPSPRGVPTLVLVLPCARVVLVGGMAENKYMDLAS